MLGPYIHRIDAILLDVGGVHLWWYGLGFALGFLDLHLFLRRGGGQLRLSPREVWSLSLYMTIGVLVGGRALEIAFDEWPFYREHLHLLPAWWLGGMATHGLLLGGALGAALFARRYAKPFLLVADALVIPAAFLMGVGRIGNFIDGQIVGAVTDVPWAVEFPYAEGFRHPVVLLRRGQEPAADGLAAACAAEGAPRRARSPPASCSGTRSRASSSTSSGSTPPTGSPSAPARP
jgi:phosphatidylglycerol:prolipoprotein diacylglycerol transferase